MRRTRNTSHRVYTQAEKVAIVSEIARRCRSEGRSVAAIAGDLGVSPANYYKWRSDGIIPQPTQTPSARRPYPAADKQQLMAQVEDLLGAGKNLRVACQMVGISDKSFRKWRADADSTTILRPVEITGITPVTVTPASAGLSLIAPGGFRVEGLTIETAAQLLKALS